MERLFELVQNEREKLKENIADLKYDGTAKSVATIYQRSARLRRMSITKGAHRTPIAALQSPGYNYDH